MNIIFDPQVAEELRQKHILLELDTLEINQQTRTLWCVMENYNYHDVPDIFEFADLHQQFMALYKAGHYVQCLELLPKLESYQYPDMCSFYSVMNQRLLTLLQTDPSQEKNLLVIE